MPSFETSEPNAPATAEIAPVVCLVCGCLCDDIVVVKEGDRVREVRNACEKGREWFLRDRSEPEKTPLARINGAPADADEAVAKAAELLKRARAPVILGLSGSTNETVAAAIELADRVGAVIEAGNGRASSSARIMAYQRVGRVSATLGEVKNRADVVVFWGADPVVTHPRHWERYSVEPRGRFVPEGRAGRTVIVVDQERTATAEQADLFLEIERTRQFEALWVLRALVRGIKLDGRRVNRSTGCEPEDLQQLASRLAAARYGAFFHGTRLTRGTPAEAEAAATATIEAASGLVRDLNEKTRFVMLAMGEPGNRPGAEAVLTWQTGFPAGVDLGPGYPRSLPCATSTRARLLRGEADAALIVGEFSIDTLDSPAKAHFLSLPKITIAPPDSAGAGAPSGGVRLSASLPGLEEDGTVTRIDGLSLRLSPVRSGVFPSERDWIERITRRLPDQESGGVSTMTPHG